MASALEDPILIRNFKGHKDAVTCVAFSPNTKALATSSLDRYLMIWNLRPNSKAFRFAGHMEGVTSVEFSPDGQLLASASQDRTARLWIPCVHGESTPLKGHTASVRSVNFSHDGQYLVTASNDKLVKVWSIYTQTVLFTLFQHTHWVRCAKFFCKPGAELEFVERAVSSVHGPSLWIYSPDGRLIVSCSEDKSVKIWDVRNRICVDNIIDCDGFANYVDFSPDGTCIACAGSDHTVKIWDIRTNKLLQNHQVHRAAINYTAFHPSGNYLITASTDGTIKIIDLLGGRLLYTLHGHEGPVLSVAFAKGGEIFASGGLDTQVLLWKTNFDAFEYKKVLKKHMRRIHVDEPPHLLDIYPRSPHRHDGKPQSVEIDPSHDVADMRTFDPTVIDISSSFSSCQAKASPSLARPSMSQDVVNNEDALQPPASPSPTMSKRVSQTENLGHAVEEPVGISPVLSNALEHIVEQLDVLTLTISILEQRLTLTEDKVKECLENQERVLLSTGN